jgi:beta propeller repeat protein
MLRMTYALRTCAFALGVTAAIGATVRADAGGSSQQLGGGTAGWTQNAPELSGSGVVWTNYDGTQFDVYYQDVSVAGGAPINLTASLPGDQFLEDIDQTAAVLTNTKPGAASSDILLVDTTTLLTTSIASGGTTVNFAHPAISDAWIVFERITTQYDIDLVDRTTNSSPGFQVTFDAAAQRFPRVSGNVVVYEDYNANPNVASVFGCQIGTVGCTTFSVAAVGRQPDIDGDNVVYVGKDAAGSDQIFLYSISAATTTQLTTASSSKSQPRVSGNRVVWGDQRSGDYDIYSYDLTAKTETLIIGTAGVDETLGDIDGDRVVYQTSTGGVFVFTFSTPPPPPPPPPTTLPLGCDPTKTDLVAGPTTSTQPSKRPVYAGGGFTTVPGKTYYLCVMDGNAQGANRTAQILVTVDNGLVLTPADFMPQKNPPAAVAAKLALTNFLRERDDDRGRCGHGDPTPATTKHEWASALFGAAGSTIAVSIRVAK